METLLILIPLLLACGVVAGLLAGMLGVGGGIVIVPMLYHVFIHVGVDAAVVMPLAVGTSLATIVVTASMSSRSHHARGNVDVSLLRRWIPAVLVGVVTGTALGSVLPGETLLVLFGAFMALIATHMLLTAGRSVALTDTLPGKWGQRGAATGIGGLAALLGVGGGTLVVPYLNFFKFPMHRAVGSSAVLGLVVAIPASIGYILSGWGAAGLPVGSTGYVNWLAFGLIVPMTMLFAPLGVRLCQRLDVTRLRRAFAVLLVAVGIKMLFF